MEGEMNNFIMVWATTLVSITYCYVVGKVASKGRNRLITFLPVICLFLQLPLNLNSIHFVCTSSFFISWLSNFKLLLHAFGLGPLSDPCLSLARFLFVASLPVKVQRSPISKDNSDKKEGNGSPSTKPIKVTISSIFKKLSILVFLYFLDGYREQVEQNLAHFVLCIFIYLGLDFLLSVSAILGQVLLGLELDVPFHEPYLSSSLQEFWGRRWNRISSSVLHPAVYAPILNVSKKKLSPKWAPVPAIMVSFFVSGLMHELFFFHLGRQRPTGQTTLFFVCHGIVLVVEGQLKEFGRNWKLPRIITGPLIFGFATVTFMWVILPQILPYNLIDRGMEEYAAMFSFLRDVFGLSQVFEGHVWKKND